MKCFFSWHHLNRPRILTLPLFPSQNPVINSICKSFCSVGVPWNEENPITRYRVGNRRSLWLSLGELRPVSNPKEVRSARKKLAHDRLLQMQKMHWVASKLVLAANRNRGTQPRKTEEGRDDGFWQKSSSGNDCC